MLNKAIILLVAMFFVTQSNAQQNFFNVPSSDLTEKKKIFFQQQINVLKGSFQSASTFDVGLGKGFEIGVNYLGFALEKDNNRWNTVFEDKAVPYSPFLALNLQKRFELGEHLGLGIGTQLGTTTTSFLQKTGEYFYSNLVYFNEKIGLKMVGGAYSASKSFFGLGDRLFNNSKIGIQAGVEKALVKEKLVFQADFISGKHNLGEAVIGGAYFLTKNLILSAGYQIPTMSSLSSKGLVFELTYNPK